MKPLEKARQDLVKAKKKRDASKKRLEADELTRQRMRGGSHGIGE